MNLWEIYEELYRMEVVTEPFYIWSKKLLETEDFWFRFFNEKEEVEWTN